LIGGLIGAWLLTGINQYVGRSSASDFHRHLHYLKTAAPNASHHASAHGGDGVAAGFLEAVAGVWGSWPQQPGGLRIPARIAVA
jgi:hypothetical protein